LGSKAKGQPILPLAENGHRPGLFQIFAIGVAGWVIGQKTKDKQKHKEGNNNINDYFEGFHPDHSKGY
jgi:hypothetical protein